MKTSVYVAVALVAGAVGFGIYRFALAPRLETPQTAVVAEPERLIPELLPEFSLKDREDQLRSIKGWPGKSMIVNFWATWCAPCRKEIPVLNELQRTRGAEGFQVVGIAVDFREDVLKFANQFAIDYPILIGEQEGLEAVSKFGIEAVGFPFTVFTDNQARIVSIHLGELTQPQLDVLTAVVTRVNKGELTPAAAKIVVATQLSALPRGES